MIIKRLSASILFLLLFVAHASAASSLPTHVVMMLDRSGSTQPGGDLSTQIAGYAAALERAEVGEALAAANAHISVVAWSGPGDQLLLVDARHVAAQSDARALADEMRSLPLTSGGLTDLAAALGHAIEHLDEVAKDSPCAVIILATDQLATGGYAIADAQDQRLRAAEARALALERNIIVHGFGLEDPSVAQFLRQNVATPRGDVAFVPTAPVLADEMARLLMGDFCRIAVAGTLIRHLAG